MRQRILSWDTLSVIQEQLLLSLPLLPSTNCLEVFSDSLLVQKDLGWRILSWDNLSVIPRTINLLPDIMSASFKSFEVIKIEKYLLDVIDIWWKLGNGPTDTLSSKQQSKNHASRQNHRNIRNSDEKTNTKKLKVQRSYLCLKASLKPTESISDADYGNDQALLANTPAEADSLLLNLEQAAKCIGLYMNSDMFGSVGLGFMACQPL